MSLAGTLLPANLRSNCLSSRIAPKSAKVLLILRSENRGISTRVLGGSLEVRAVHAVDAHKQEHDTNGARGLQDTPQSHSILKCQYQLTML